MIPSILLQSISLLKQQPRILRKVSERMPITFENDNDVIVYALGKVISYARDNQFIFLAQIIWWISSIIGLQQGLVDYMDNLRIRLESCSRGKTRLRLVREIVSQVEDRESSVRTSRFDKAVSATPRDIQEDPGPSEEASLAHPGRINHGDNTIHDISDGLNIDSELEHLSRVIDSSEQFVQYSRKKRKAFGNQKEILSRTRSGRIPVPPLTKKQSNRLQAIPKSPLPESLDQRK